MRQYLAYKPSGVDWLGKIPIGWEPIKLKYISNRITKGTTPTTVGKAFVDNGINFIKVECISETGTIIKENCAFIDEETHNILNRSQLKKGDVIIAIAGAIGRVAIIEDDIVPANTNQAVGIISVKKKKYNLQWVKYVLNSDAVKQYYNIEIVKTAQANISLENVGLAILPTPLLPEQKSIVCFLDYTTGQIDTFIANRQKQIELLKEQLHFKINEAITKGINTKVQFKAADIKYVPEIPEHWDIRKFKSLTSILTCGVAATPEYVDENEGVAFLSAQNCRPFAMDLSKYSYIKPALHKQLTRYKKPQKGDVLVTRVGAGIGQACIIDTDLEFSVYVSLTHIRPNKEILSEYIVYFFNTEYCYQLNHEGTVVGGGQGNLNVKNVERYRIPLPPIEEQKEIIKYLDKYRTEMDTLISKYQKQIDLMQEYRASLISQAVTGKIDVRDWQPKKKEKQ
ncbi:MAG: restriction endonuclease subunit S [Elusimicrobia bacterium]|nr:restriction endonuclease subunit S [Candidatus Liberimonas magnetica]